MIDKGDVVQCISNTYKNINLGDKYICHGNSLSPQNHVMRELGFNPYKIYIKVLNDHGGFGWYVASAFKNLTKSIEGYGATTGSNYRAS